MPVNTPRSDYKSATARWARCRDTYSGEEAVKAAGQAYLPQLSGQDVFEYAAYKMRAQFFNAVERTVHGLVGTIMRKDPKVEVPNVMKVQVDDVTLTGVPLLQASTEALDELVLVGRYGILIDMPNEETTIKMLAGKQLARPYWVPYKTEQIINWATGTTPDGHKQLTMVVLHETDTERSEFDVIEGEQIRVLILIEGVYTVQIWKPKKEAGAQIQSNQAVWEKVEEFVPKMRGAALGFIPFVGFTPYHLGLDIVKPPLLDLVDTNLSQYRTLADLENGAHWCGVPQPWIAGSDASSLTMGGPNAWIFEDPTAKADILEFTGQGLGALEKRVDEKTKQMAILGGRLLESMPTGHETAEAVRLRHRGETSVLGKIAKTTASGLKRCLIFQAFWQGLPTEAISYIMNNDFFDTIFDAQTINALVTGWQDGAMSYKTLYANLQKMELTRDGVTAEEEQAEIDGDGDPEGEPAPGKVKRAKKIKDLPNPKDDDED